MIVYVGKKKNLYKIGMRMKCEDEYKIGRGEFFNWESKLFQKMSFL